MVLRGLARVGRIPDLLCRRGRASRGRRPPLHHDGGDHTGCCSAPTAMDMEASSLLVKM